MSLPIVSVPSQWSAEGPARNSDVDLAQAVGADHRGQQAGEARQAATGDEAATAAGCGARGGAAVRRR